eukprot:430572-Pyramimonas_sp.AAC.1
MCCRVPIEPKPLPSEPPVGCSQFPPARERLQVQQRLRDADSAESLAECWDEVLIGLEAELLDRHGARVEAERRQHHGNAGPPQHKWQQLKASAPNQP